jgi:hypothetical protein
MKKARHPERSEGAQGTVSWVRSLAALGMTAWGDGRAGLSHA